MGKFRSGKPKYAWKVRALCVMNSVVEARCINIAYCWYSCTAVTLVT